MFYLNHRSHKLNIAIAVRATGERTLTLLLEQLKSQMELGDEIAVFSKQEPFHEKMEQVYLWCIQQNAEISLVIDADILLRKNVLNKIRLRFRKLPKDSSGFGIMLFDRFFQRPKFRGLHVYRTKYLPLFLQFLPLVTKSIRPETELKKRVEELGFAFKNDFVKFYVAGLHDYFQWYRDIYWKMIIRSQRSQDLIAIDYIPKEDTLENKIVQDALSAGLESTSIPLDKANFSFNYDFVEQPKLEGEIDTEHILFTALKKHYGFGMFYISSCFIWSQNIMIFYLKYFKRSGNR